jgi:glycine betaine/proline transport system substrate-binding protein
MRMMKRGLLASALVAVLAQGPALAAAPESNEPIKIVMNNWTSQNVLATVVGILLQEQGYTVEYVPSDTQLQFAAMAAGDLHFQVEVWEGSMITAYEAGLAQGLADYGAHDAVTREEWWYPLYVKDVCPGLPDWKALDACADKFATAETSPKGRFVGPPADWGKHYSERIQALGMNFQEMAVGQAATLWAELQAAYDRKEPVVLFNWTPNFIEAKFEGEFVDFPDYEAECLTDAKWGINPNSVYDCGAPKSGWLRKAGWKGLAETWPQASEFLKKVNFTNEQIAQAAALVDVEALSVEEAAAKWIAENEATWSAWMPN